MVLIIRDIMSCRFFIIKLKTFIITVFLILMLLYVGYVCYSVFFTQNNGIYI